MFFQTAFLSLVLAQDLSESTFEKLKAEIIPPKSELKWLEIPWQITLWDAIVAGQKEDRPILFYAMNGHPLAAC